VPSNSSPPTTAVPADFASALWQGGGNYTLFNSSPNPTTILEETFETYRSRLAPPDLAMSFPCAHLPFAVDGHIHPARPDSLPHLRPPTHHRRSLLTADPHPRSRDELSMQRALSTERCSAPAPKSNCCVAPSAMTQYFSLPTPLLPVPPPPASKHQELKRPQARRLSPSHRPEHEANSPPTHSCGFPSSWYCGKVGELHAEAMAGRWRSFW
jgi:hypothetical protein